MEGKGVMRYADGGIYEVGRHQQDLRHQPHHRHHHYSTVIIICQGRWRCGLREGMGEIVFHNGDYYRGQWAADNMTDGFGKFTCKTFFGRFSVRHLFNFGLAHLFLQKLSMASFSDPDGTVYLGEIVGGSTVSIAQDHYQH